MAKEPGGWKRMSKQDTENTLNLYMRDRMGRYMMVSMWHYNRELIIGVGTIPQPVWAKDPHLRTYEIFKIDHGYHTLLGEKKKKKNATAFAYREMLKAAPRIF